MATVSAPEVVRERPRLASAAAFALLAEVLLLGGGVVLLTHRSQPAPERPPTLLTLTAPAPAAAPMPQPFAKPLNPPKPEAPPVTHPVVPPRHVQHVAHVAPPKAEPVPVPTPAPMLPSATPTDAPPAPRQPSPPPAAAPAATAPNASFEGALRAAIQAALRYPESARMAGMSGRTRVAFQYRDGVVSDVSVVVSSGIGLLDRAALAAVRDAAYPKPEPAFVGKTLSEQLWVTFNLDDHDS
jgi:periplasmic protein TonB